jgi:steroid 5-alpha reductase family enzyme
MVKLAPYLQLGAKLPWWQCLFFYISPMWFLLLPPDSDIRRLFLDNAAMQAAIFLPLVVVPVLRSGKMVYVDIGWPLGLTAIGACALWGGTGWWLRKTLASSAMLLHGGRMALGGIAMFGLMTGFSYRFKEDLPRYRFARLRWETVDGMPAGGWWIKQLHDVVTQGLANAIMLCAPTFVSASDPEPRLRPLEAAGYALWLLSWLVENWADVQKQLFLAECKLDQCGRDAGNEAPSAKAGNEATAGGARAGAEQAGGGGGSGPAVRIEHTANRNATLGAAPFDGARYWLWVRCRHPNYFGELLGWIGLTLAGLPSLWSLWAHAGSPAEAWAAAGIGGLYLLLPLFFYDCLVHWTGAGPAEHYSAIKRPAYRQYQRSTRCLWPFELPLVDHFREPGWPHTAPE